VGVTTVLGIRCWSDRYAYVVLSGDADHPTLKSSKNVSLPVNEERASQLSTFRRDIMGLLAHHGVKSAVFRSAEGNAQSMDSGRAEVEGVFQEACFSNSPSVPVRGLVKTQVRKLLQYEGRVKDVFTFFGQTPFTNLAKSHFAEAVVIALAEMA
jgi:hypothetical protein